MSKRNGHEPTEVEEMQLYAQAEELGGFAAKALKAQALWAYENRKDKQAMRIASFVWGRNARLMARAVDYFDEIADSETYDAYYYLSRFALAQLSRDQAIEVAMQGSSLSWQLWQYRNRVDEIRAANGNGHARGESLAAMCDKLSDKWNGYGNSADKSAPIGWYEAHKTCAAELAALPPVKRERERREREAKGAK